MSIIKLTTKALHIALSTYPFKQEDEYVSHIKKMYKDFVLERGKHYDQGSEKNDGTRSITISDIEKKYTYKPLVYHMFGHYDLAFISIIDSYKFAQKVFDSSKDAFESDTNISYQIQCGTILVNSLLKNHGALIQKVAVKNLESIQEEYPYIQVTNLKLNNGLILGNGNALLEKVVVYMKNLLDEPSECIFIITNSYNWSDINLVLLSKKASFNNEKILILRRLILKDLNSDGIDEILNKSLYKKKFNYDNDLILKSHIFVDTHSYMGVSYKLFKGDPANAAGLLNEDFRTSIEWQVKPGHFSSFFKAINSKTDILSREVYYKNGKTDFVTQEVKPDKLASNKMIQEHLRSTGAIDHIRMLKTKPLHKVPDEHLDKFLSECTLDVREKLKSQKIKDIKLVNAALKKINVSRQLRTKIQKAFHNYNNAITDSIAYSTFIDFKPFLEYFKNLILENARYLEKMLIETHNGETDVNVIEKRLSVGEIEEQFDKILQAYEESYNDRFLNNYNFEDLNDFKIDFNTSISQIITTYDPIIKLLSRTLLNDKPKILVRQSDLLTKSNLFSINYNVYHLIEPALIFNTVVKEILNSIGYNLSKETKVMQVIKESDSQIRQELKMSFGIEDKYFNDFDLSYFKIDVIKFLYTFNGNVNLYLFWSWIYFFQNTSLYNSIGYIIERVFVREMYRLLLTVATFDFEFFENNKVECPIPELYNYWERHYASIKYIVTKITKLNAYNDLVCSLIKVYKNEIVLKEVRKANKKLTGQLNDLKDEYEDGKKTDGHITHLLDLYNKKYEGDFIRSRIETYTRNNLVHMPHVDTRWRTLELGYIFYHKKLEKGEGLYWPEVDASNKPEDSGSLIFNIISYATLMWYYEKMNGKIDVLRRDYYTGKAIPNFIKFKNSNFLFVDPQGDFFVTDFENQKMTMKFKHSVFQSVWHLGQIIKLSFFEEEKPESHEN